MFETASALIPRALILIMPLTGGVAAAAASETTVYTCQSESDVYYQVTIDSADGNPVAPIVPQSANHTAAQSEAETEMARPTPTASGFAFESPAYMFSGKGDDVRLGFRDYPDDAPFPCTRTASVGADEALNQPGRSLGGRLRSGPGTDYPAAGSLAEGTRVKVVRNSGVRFDGYDWFEIMESGTSAFQWGGILCWDGAPIEGMFGDCATTLPGG